MAAMTAASGPPPSEAHLVAATAAGHGRLPSIKNILSPQPEHADRATNVPRKYTDDPFRPRVKAYQTPAPILPPSLAGAPEAYGTSNSRPSTTAYGSPNHPLADDGLSRSASAMGHVMSGPVNPVAVPPPPPPTQTQSASMAAPESARVRRAGSSSPYQMYHASPASSDYRPPPPPPPPPQQQTAEPATSDHRRSHSGTSPNRASAVVRWIKNMGDCYVFPNGEYMPCSINNEPVNPEFGVTKAGKPRKRLAQACMTCREKKIKCQPGEPKCVQCHKVNRECKRPPPQSSSSSSSAVTSAVLPPSVPSGPKEEPMGMVRVEFKPPASPISAPMPASVTKKRPSSQDLTAVHVHKVEEREPVVHAPKRQRAYMEEEMPAKNFSPFHGGGSSSWGSHGRPSPPMGPHMAGPMPGQASHIDPFDKDPHTAMEFLDLYFEHRGRGPYVVFPRTTFMQWAVHCKTKSSDDIMLLYIVMAVGSRFSNTRLKKSIGQRYAQKAAALERERFGELSLQLAQTRLYFLLYYFAEGKNALGWEYLSAGLSACNALNLNTERGILSTLSDPSLYEYGMNREQLIDCRRRTFFAGYCMDRYIGHNSGHMGLLNDDDLFVRLPGPETAFNAGQPPAALPPLFSEGEVCEAFASAPGEMALLVPIVALWGDVVAQAYRAFHRPAKRQYLERHQQHYRRTYERVNEWEMMLPDHLRFSAANTAAAASRSCLSPYFIFHAIRFISLIKLNRNVDFQMMPAEATQEHIAQAMVEANNLLSIVAEVCRALSSATGGVSADVENALSQPFPGYAVMAACDVVSSGGARHDCPRIKRQLADAKVLLERIGRYWFAAGKQHDKVEKRLFKLGGMDLEACHTGIEADVWRLKGQDFCDSFPEQYDVIHGSPDSIFYGAVRRLSNV